MGAQDTSNIAALRIHNEKEAAERYYRENPDSPVKVMIEMFLYFRCLDLNRCISAVLMKYRCRDGK